MSEASHSSPVEEQVLKHGILLHKTQKFTSKVVSLIYNSAKDSLVVLLQGATIAEYQSGEQTRFVEGKDGMKFSKLLYATEYDRYVGVSYQHLYLLQNDFATLLHESISELPISCCLYNCFNDTVITAGVGYINIWRFHRGGKSLLLDHVIKEGLDNEDVSLLHAEEVPGNAQRLFAVIGNGIKVFLLASSLLMSEGKSLHSRPISAVLFFRPLTYLITGARDGSIKVWNQLWVLQYAFISHQSPVTALTPYPTGPCIISGSLDGTLKLWNLFHWDKVQEIDHALPVHGLHSEPGCHRILSYSFRQVRTWTVLDLYKRTTIVGSAATNLSSWFHPLSPLRLTGIFTDSTVRVISPVGGAIVTATILPPQLTVISSVYMSHQEWLFVLTSDGEICKYNTSTKPSKRILDWTPVENNGTYSCLALYQLTLDQEEIDDLIERDKWLSVVIEAHRMKPFTEDPLKRERQGVHLLIAGTEEGNLCVLDKGNGRTQCTVKSHSSRITNIVPHPKRDQILSITTDNCVKVWRVYAYTRECLVMMMSFSVDGVPAHVSVLFDRVCVSVNDTERASYTNTVYLLTDRVSFSSNPHSNHTEAITGLDVSTSLHMFATSSDDCTVRTWSQDNNILRILQLDAPPTAIVFSSPFGGLTISLRNHLHTISHLTHLTEGYVKQLVSLGIKEEDLKGEDPRDLIGTLEDYSASDWVRLHPMDDQLEVKSYRGALSEEELNTLDRLKEAKRQGMEEIVRQDKELKNIRDGSLTARKQQSKGLSTLLKKKAWKEVFSVIRSLPAHGIAIPPFDDFDPDTYGKAVEIPTTYEPFNPKEKPTFFPPLSKFNPPYPIAPDGFLPNSAVLQKLRKSEEDRLLAQQWRPPTLSDRQRKSLKEAEVEDEEEYSSSGGSSKLMERLRVAMTAEETPEPSRTPTPPPTPPPPPRRELKTQMKVEKIVAPKPKTKPPPPKPRTPTPPPPPRSPTPPPPPPTPLPEYIAQFIGQRWFESLYPKATSKTFPRPWTVTRFVYALVSWLSKTSVDNLTKAEICTALLKLIQQYSPSNATEVRTAVMQLLVGPPPISSQHMSERHLAKSGLQVLMHTSTDELDDSFMALLMGYYSENNHEIKELIFKYLQSKGVSDPHKYFSREMDSNFASSSSQLSDLMVKSLAWLESWSVNYLKSKGVKIPPRQTDQKRSSLRSSKSQPTLKLPRCDPVEVINHFVKTEHERELARQRPPTPPPPPPEAEEETLHDVVVPLPMLEHSRGCLQRLGETHCSKCHPERETSLAHLNHVIRTQRTISESLRTLNLSLKAQNINPFLTPEEREEAQLIEQSRNRLMSNTKLFLLEQSYPMQH